VIHRRFFLPDRKFIAVFYRTVSFIEVWPCEATWCLSPFCTHRKLGKHWFRSDIDTKLIYFKTIFCKCCVRFP